MVDKLSLPKFVNKVPLTFNINPDDSRQFQSVGGHKRWTDVRRQIMTDLLRFLPYVDELDLYPDISFPDTLGTKYPRVHYHGLIQFNDVVSFLTNFEGMSHYMIEIDTIDDKKYWAKYCRKFIKKFPDYKRYMITKKFLQEMMPLKETPNKLNIVDLCNKYDDDSDD